MIKKYLKKWSAMYLILSLFYVSCGDKDLLEFDKISDSIDWQPNLFLPVGTGSFTLWDFLKDENSDSTIVNENNKLIIRHVEPDVYKMDLSEVFTLPEQNVTERINLPVNLDELPGSGDIVLTEDIILTKRHTVVLSLEAGSSMTNLEAAMKMDYVFSGNPLFNYKVSLVLENAKVGTDTLKIIESVDDGNNVADALTYGNVVFDMNTQSNSITYRVDVTIPKGQTINKNADLDVDIEFGLSGFQLNVVRGTISPKVFDIPQETFDLGVDFLKEIGGNFKFTNPQLKLIVRNQGIGVPILLDMGFKAYGEGGKTAVFAGAPLKFNGDPFGNYIEEELGYNKSNSNIVDVLSLPPTSIEYEGEVTVNPNTSPVILRRGGNVAVDLKMEIPLSLSADSLIYQDTIKGVDVSESDVEKIQQAAIVLTVVNGLALDMTMDGLILLDDNHRQIDYVASKGRIKAATVEGGIVKPTQNDPIKITLSSTNIKNLGKSKYIVMKLKASTAGREVDILADSKLEFKLALQAKIDARF